MKLERFFELEESDKIFILEKMGGTQSYPRARYVGQMNTIQNQIQPTTVNLPYRYDPINNVWIISGDSGEIKNGNSLSSFRNGSAILRFTSTGVSVDIEAGTLTAIDNGDSKSINYAPGNLTVNKYDSVSSPIMDITFFNNRHFIFGPGQLTLTSLEAIFTYPITQLNQPGAEGVYHVYSPIIIPIPKK